MLKDFPCILYNYIESGPYRDIYDKLNLSVRSKIVTNSRASMYELLRESSGYFIDSPPPVPVDNRELTEESERPRYRVLTLSGCEVKTEYGWIMRKGHSRTPIEEECVDLVTQLIRG